MGTPIIDLEGGWKDLYEGGIKRLETMLNDGLTNASTAPFSPQEFMRLHDLVYKMCTQRHPYNYAPNLYTRYTTAFSNYLALTVRPAILNQRGDLLLVELARRWKNHSEVMNKWMSRFFNYLNRYYVHHNNLLRLTESGTHEFKKQVFDHMKSHVTEALITCINNERDGEQSNVSNVDVLKSCIQVYQFLGDGTTEVYVKDFQVPLLAATRQYYMRKSAAWLATDNVPTYLTKVEEAITAESERCSSYLLESTLPDLLKQVEDVLLKAQLQKLVDNDGSGLKVLLRDDKREDLARLYRMLGRLGEEGLEPVALIFRTFVQDIGQGIIREREALAQASEGSEGKEPDSAAFIIQLIDLHEKVQAIVTREFQCNSRFQVAQKLAFEVFVNKNPSNTKTTNIEALSAFFDRLLQGKEKLSETQLEEKLKQAIDLFSYVSEKDTFQNLYSLALSKRLLSSRSVSMDCEKAALSLLKFKCGANYTSKLESMLNDMLNAGDENTKYNS